MSRSRKRLPICGVTTAASDRDWKRDSHTRMRAATREALHHGREMPTVYECSDVWNSDKDGKQWCANWPKAARK